MRTKQVVCDALPLRIYGSERAVSDLVDLAYALTPEEIELMWT